MTRVSLTPAFALNFSLILSWPICLVMGIRYSSMMKGRALCQALYKERTRMRASSLLTDNNGFTWKIIILNFRLRSISWCTLLISLLLLGSKYLASFLICALYNWFYRTFCHMRKLLGCRFNWKKSYFSDNLHCFCARHFCCFWSSVLQLRILSANAWEIEFILSSI